MATEYQASDVDANGLLPNGNSAITCSTCALDLRQGVREAGGPERLPLRLRRLRGGARGGGGG